MNKIYLDYSATTPMNPNVLAAMKPYFCDIFGNASSIHHFGQDAMAGVDKAREQVASFLNCDPDEVVFTSGATESNNLVILGVIKAILREASKIKSPQPPFAKEGNLHVITSLIEHPAILAPCEELEKIGVEVTYLPVDSSGVVSADKLKKEIKDNTVLVSIMHVNNEVGSIQPIREIGKNIKKLNDKKLNDWKKLSPKVRGEKPRPVYFHTDATQAVNFLNCDVRWNYVDLLSMSGHKICGPRGVGALYIKSGVPVKPLQLGGHQENSIRSGTYNVPGIVGLGEATRLLDKKEVEKNNIKIGRLRDKLVEGLKKNISDIILNTDIENSTPSHANISFLGVEGESLLISLDLEGIAVSTGSACASGKLEASHVLLAMGIKQEVSHTSIRFSLGKYTTSEDVEKVIKVLPPIVKKLRNISPLH